MEAQRKVSITISVDLPLLVEVEKLKPQGLSRSEWFNILIRNGLKRWLEIQKGEVKE